MTPAQVPDAARNRAGGYKVDVTRGERIGRVSPEWFARPADERYLSLSDLFSAVRSRTQTIAKAAALIALRSLRCSFIAAVLAPKSAARIDVVGYRIAFKRRRESPPEAGRESGLSRAGMVNMEGVA